jgi:hypothetical protein
MDRRAFFGHFLGGSAVGAVILASGTAVVCQTDRPIEYRMFTLRWTGWKCSEVGDFWVGQWVAWPKRRDHPMLYVCVPPGGHGQYRVGEVFDVSVKSPKQLVTIATDPRIKDQLLHEGFARIVGLVDRFYLGEEIGFHEH